MGKDRYACPNIYCVFLDVHSFLMHFFTGENKWFRFVYIKKKENSALNLYAAHQSRLAVEDGPEVVWQSGAADRSQAQTLGGSTAARGRSAMLLRFLGRICGDAVGSAARRLHVRNPSLSLPSPLSISPCARCAWQRTCSSSRDYRVRGHGYLINRSNPCRGTSATRCGGAIAPFSSTGSCSLSLSLAPSFSSISSASAFSFPFSRRRRFVQFRAERDFYAGVWSEAAGSARRLRKDVEDETERFCRGLWGQRFVCFLLPPWMSVKSTIISTSQ
jgi:hypothetical protein